MTSTSGSPAAAITCGMKYDVRRWACAVRVRSQQPAPLPGSVSPAPAPLQPPLDFRWFTTTENLPPPLLAMKVWAIGARLLTALPSDSALPTSDTTDGL